LSEFIGGGETGYASSDDGDAAHRVQGTGFDGARFRECVEGAVCEHSV
jgi:hypothetical protein